MRQFSFCLLPFHFLPLLTVPVQAQSQSRLADMLKARRAKARAAEIVDALPDETPRPTVHEPSPADVVTAYFFIQDTEDAIWSAWRRDSCAGAGDDEPARRGS